jgi:hypothetical protein
MAQALARGARELLVRALAAVVLGEEVLGQQIQILVAAAQRRQVDREHEQR